MNRISSLLLAMYIGNDIPKGEVGCCLKWCPVRNEMASTACTVTRVTARRRSRGHGRQDIPLGEYDRKHQRWTPPGKNTSKKGKMQCQRGTRISLILHPPFHRPPRASSLRVHCSQRRSHDHNIIWTALQRPRRDATKKEDDPASMPDIEDPTAPLPTKE